MDYKQEVKEYRNRLEDAVQAVHNGLLRAQGHLVAARRAVAAKDDDRALAHLEDHRRSRRRVEQHLDLIEEAQRAGWTFERSA